MARKPLVQLLLLAYPPALRREHGDEIALAISESWRSQRSTMGRVRFVAHLAADSVRSWPRAWRARRGLTGRDPGGRRRGWRRTFGGDLKAALRMFTHAPWFTGGAVLTLALGVGATTAIATLADATLLRPLPIPEPDRVLQTDWSWSHPDFRDLEARQRAFAEIAAWTLPDIGLEVDGRTVALEAAAVSRGYMRLAGIRAVAGRVLDAGDDRPGAPPVLMLSERLWQRLFDRRPDVVGSTLMVNGRAVTVAGIVPQRFRGFSLSESPEVFFPLAATPEIATGFLARPGIMNNRGAAWLQIVGRLRPGATQQQAELDVEGIYRQLHPPASTTPAEPLRLTPVAVRAIGVDVVDDVRRFVSVLAGATVVTLLLACATVANLLLVRAERRQRELAVRAALGAGRLRMLRLLMTESFAIGIAGGAAGVLVARLCLALLARFSLPGRIPVADLDLSVRSDVLLAALALGMATSLIFGLAPLWRFSRLDVTASLRQGDRGSARQPLRSTLIAAQVALCVLLLGGGLAFGRAVRQAFAIDLGFDTRHTATARVDPTLARYGQDQMADFGRRVLDRVSSVSWVTAAGWSAMPPLTGRMTWGVAIAGQSVDLDTNVVSEGYFEAMGIPLVAGRTFTAGDTASAPRAAIVNSSLAKRFWPDGRALGGRVMLDTDKPADSIALVVGVVGDVRRGLERQPDPTLYLSIAQHPDLLTFGRHVLVVRSETIPASDAARQLAALLRQVDPRVPVLSVESLFDQIGTAAMAHRLGFMLFALFGSLAIVLTTLGVYAVVAFAVARRAREIGIRVALGAQASQIVRLVIRQGARPLVIGLTIGVLAFRLASSVLSRFALSLPIFDLRALAFLAGSIAVIAVVAMLTPARRALSIDPAVTLRTD